MKFKINPQTTFQVVILIVCMTLQVRGQTQTDSACKLRFAEEYSLQVISAPYIIDESTIQARVQLFDDCIKCTDEKKCAVKGFEISAMQMVELYKKAEQIRVARNDKCKDKACITGVWIYLAKKGDDVHYYFQPSVFMSKPSKPNLNTPFYKVGDEFMYKYEGNHFSPIPDYVWEPEVTEYRQDIRNRRKERRKYREGIFEDRKGHPVMRWRGDARKVFFSFQEILGFYSLLNPNENPSSCHAGSIYVNSYADKFDRKTKSTGKGKRVKHTMYITASRGTEEFKKFAISTTSQAGADLAHVCPSVCSELTYPSNQTAELYIKLKASQIKLE